MRNTRLPLPLFAPFVSHLPPFLFRCSIGDAVAQSVCPAAGKLVGSLPKSFTSPQG